MKDFSTMSIGELEAHRNRLQQQIEELQAEMAAAAVVLHQKLRQVEVENLSDEEKQRRITQAKAELERLGG